ncbi:MAG: glycosyltransferase family 4 protein [Pseudomarimonas sp.]
MGRILYFSHDIATPRGGIGIQYEHVSVLRRNGFDAYVVHAAPNFRYPFGAAEVPVLDSAAGLEYAPDDVLVIPEDHPTALLACRDATCSKVLFCQNHYYVFHGLAPGAAWKDYGFSSYLCLSDPIRQALKDWFGVDANVIRPCIDPIFFGAKTPRADSLVTLAGMPRKGRDTLRLVQGLLATNGWAKTAGVTWLLIDGMRREQVAAALRLSHIFVSTGQFEGLGLPPLEAMAARCLVVGFAAGGGLDYATPGNGVWVPDEDPWALATALKQTVAALKDPQSRPELFAKIDAGHATARKYGRERFERDLLAFWSARQ